jgi:2',3'-cyclic-nucleotide 2'-phosphodiesterase (5'-nucleotidase family)
MKYRLIVSFVCVLLLGACAGGNHGENLSPDLPSEQIVVLYENDVHCAVDGYSMLASLRNACSSRTSYVSTVSCGDFASGGLMGAISKGEAIVEIMNYVGYDVVTLGNHELDYGMTQMFALTEALNAPVVCANLKNVQTDTYLYPAYHMVRYGEVDVAYIGFTTTTSGTATSLSDGQGNPLYSFMRDEFYTNAQHFIDEARGNGADYVIALAHLGDSDKTGGHPNSIGLICNTTGIDAVIDGHDHHVIEKQFVTNREGRPVLLTSAGTNFQYVGQLIINTDGSVQSSLIDITNSNVDAHDDTQQFIDQLKENVSSQGNFVIGNSEVELSIYAPDGNRIVRTQETNIGDFCTDALRSFTDADISLVNGGGIRSNIKRGEILFNDLYNVMPFGDMIATGTISGEQLLDVLEFAVSALPAESGTFMQVSGLCFEVNANIPSAVIKDAETGMFSQIGEGERRVSNVKVLDKQSGEYKPVELSRQYTIATLDYLIFEQGGSGILNSVKPESTYWGADIEILHHYLESNLGKVIGSEYGEPQGRIIFK